MRAVRESASGCVRASEKCGEGELGEESTHRVASDACGMRCRVDQPENRLRGRPRRAHIELWAERPKRLDPQVDVGQLCCPYGVLDLARQVRPLALLHDDQRGVREREVDMPVDERPERIEGG